MRGFMLKRHAKGLAVTLMSHADDTPRRPPDELAGDVGRLTVRTQKLVRLVILVMVENDDRERRERPGIELQYIGGGQNELVKASHPCGGITVTELRENPVVRRDGQSPGMVACDRLA